MKSVANIMLAFAALLLSACGGGEGTTTPVPRQYAFPRIDMSADTAYVPAPEELPLEFPVSTAGNASVTQKNDNNSLDNEKSTWLTVEYPAYNATLYCTFMDAESNEARLRAIANRRERIGLNLNGAPFSDTVFTTDGGFNAIIIKSPHALSTPLQFIADDGQHWIVSGSLFFSNPPSPAAVDSVSPIVNSVYRHIIHGINGLQPK